MTPSPMMQEGFFWTMVNVILHTTKHNSVNDTWDSVECKHCHGELPFQFNSKIFIRDGGGGPGTTSSVTALFAVINYCKENNWDCLNDLWSQIPWTSWRTSHGKNFHSYEMQKNTFSFVLYILSAQPCSSMQKACTGPRYTLLLSIV